MIIEKADIFKPPISLAPQRPTRSSSPLPSQSSTHLPTHPPTHPTTHPRSHYGNTPITPPSYKPPPIVPVVYAFTPLPFNSMRLSALDSTIQGTADPYHISVSLNCFTPSSYITSVRKINQDGELVGDFEMGPSASKIPSTVCFRGNEHPMDDLLVPSSRLFRNYWIWKAPDPDKYLYWDDSAGGGVITCFSAKDKSNSTFLAKFSPRSHLRRQGRQPEYTKLEVTPQGHFVFEDILMSALIIERIRTNPS